MIVLACDLARSSGFAHGEAGHRPVSGVWTLRPEGQGDMWDQPRALALNLLDIARKRGRPDLIAVEQPMDPASRAGDGRAVASQHLLHGALYAYAGAAGIDIVRAAPATIRKHLCGKATARAVVPPGSSKGVELRLHKQATKQMVADRLVLLGLADRGMPFDETDAIAVHAWCSDVHARRPIEFRMFG